MDTNSIEYSNWLKEATIAERNFFARKVGNKESSITEYIAHTYCTFELTMTVTEWFEVLQYASRVRLHPQTILLLAEITKALNTVYPGILKKISDITDYPFT